MFKFYITQLDLNNKLGGTPLSSVYPYAEKNKHKKSIVKCIHAKDYNEVSQILQDIIYVSISKHPFLVPIEGYTVQKDDFDGWRVFIKSPRMAGSLVDALKNPYVMPSYWIVVYFFSLASYLDSLKLAKISHRNLKPSNILFDKEGKMYLSDLSMTRFSKGQEMLGSLADTHDSLLYIPPEMLALDHEETEENMAKADSWSLGMIILQLCLRNVQPIPLLMSAETKMKIIRNYLHRIPTIYGRDGSILAAILSNLLQMDPLQRKTFEYARKALQTNFPEMIRPILEDQNFHTMFPQAIEDDEQIDIVELDSEYFPLVPQEKKPEVEAKAPVLDRFRGIKVCGLMLVQVLAYTVIFIFSGIVLYFSVSSVVNIQYTHTETHITSPGNRGSTETTGDFSKNTGSKRLLQVSLDGTNITSLDPLERMEVPEGNRRT